MLKYRADAPPVNNQVLGQRATLDLDVGYRYLMADLIITVAKTAATAGFAAATLAEVLSLIDIKVNTLSRRQHTAAELDAIQTRWSADLASVAINGVANDLVTAAADVVVDANTTRTTTFIVPICFMEPTRDSYTAREAFAWPTKWKSGRTAKIQIALDTLATAGFAGLAIRAEVVYDFVLGPVGTDGKDAMPITHFYRDNVVYSSTTPVLDKWPFAFQGSSLQQVSVFCPHDDCVATFEFKGDDTVIRKGSKATGEIEATRFNWNSAAINADRFDYAFDHTDDPMDALPLTGLNRLRANLTLTQAAAVNKNLIVISQVYRDAFA